MLRAQAAPPPCWTRSRRAFVVALVPALFACSGFVPAYLDSATPTVTAPLPVLANAGADREVLRGFVTRLDARGSYHPTSEAFSVHWRQTAGEPVHLSNSTGLKPSFLAPLDEQQLTFELTADDGFWTTTDSVSIFVSERPERRAPRVRAAADRRLEFGEDDTPRLEDILGDPAEDTGTRWQHIHPILSQNLDAAAGPRAPANPELQASIFRLEATRDELCSAPDYLLLHRFDEDARGDQPPSASVLAPEVIAPGETFVLDASDSGDANGDSLRIRWELLEGDLTAEDSADYAANATQHSTWKAASQPQEVVVRAIATDGLLDSSPADVSMVVSPDAPFPDLSVLPRLNRRTHPGNTVVLDARATADSAPTGVEYEWQQTAGPPVSAREFGDGRLVEFTAPTEPTELAFSVRASVEEADPEIMGEPSVVRLEVLPDSDNEPPRVFLCASTLTPEAGLSVTVVARILDPEDDVMSAPQWSVDDGASGLVDWQSASGSPSSGVCSDPRASVTGAAATSHAEVQTPTTASIFVVQASACDLHGACGTAEITLETK